MEQVPLIVVIYDGIDNSVFDSQVIQPLLNRLETDPHQSIKLISFEKQKPHASKILSKIPQHPSLTFTPLKKIPYVGLLSLYYAVRLLKKVLKNYSTYNVLARGPLAGFICQKSYQEKSCISLTIQARGLLAQEYLYEYSHETSLLKQWWRAFRASQFFNLEKKTFNKIENDKKNSTIQAVSKALADYLITVYDANPLHITIAKDDFPPAVAENQKNVWKKEIREQLQIASDSIVYCYNGSIKPWQCPELVVNYFKQKHQEKSNSLLYILTQDTAQFEELIKRNDLPKSSYRIMEVHHTQIYRYLTAADVGIIFRKPHIINWVSRPTKVLEYRAAGVAIEHNNTVSWLLEKTASFPEQQHTD